jgi:hypothetical protein
VGHTTNFTNDRE